MKNEIIEDKKVLDLEGNFRIPLYQRSYAWRKDEVEQLIEDLKLFQTKRLSNRYFLGNIVVSKNGNFLDVIDGQQRLTTLFLILKFIEKQNYNLNYEIREDDNIFLKNLSKEDFKNPTNSTFKESMEVIRDKKISKELLNDVFVTITYIPDSMDVVKYFEVMNNRGKQLEKHQILKAKFLDKLQTYKYKKWAKIWDYCSQMNTTIDNLIYYNDFKKEDKKEEKLLELRNNLLKTFTHEIFDNKNSEENDLKTINDLLKNEKTDKEEKEEYILKEYRSIVKFPIFLIHVLKIFLAKENNDFAHIKTNDRYLLEYFVKDNELIFEKEKAKEFLEFLLKMRILFDNYILKRDEKENPIIFKNENKNMLMLQLLFNFSSPQYFAQDWISVVLAYLDKNNNIDIEKFLEEFDKELSKVRLSKKGIIEFINEKIENIYYGKEINITLSESLENILNQGTSTPHYWFYKLDYLLWKKNNFKEFKNPFNDFDYSKIKDSFRLSRLNSIEHIFPQNPEKYCGEWDKNKCDIDNFGNLALISNHMNSSFSNQCFYEKRLDLQKQLQKGTIESLKLLLVYSKYDKWNENNCEAHYNEMIDLLKYGLLKENIFNFKLKK